MKGSGKSENLIPPLKEEINGQCKLQITNLDKAEFLNRYFTSISNINDDNVFLPNLNKKTDEVLHDFVVTEKEIQDIITTLNINKACGYDGISHKMLKNTCETVSKPLLILFNRSLTEGIYPGK